MSKCKSRRLLEHGVWVAIHVKPMEARIVEVRIEDDSINRACGVREGLFYAGNENVCF